MREERRGPRRSGPRRFGGPKKFGRGPKRFGQGPRQMHPAVCADCGEKCEVPFKPREDKPVYCRDCFEKHKPKRDRY